MYKTVKFDPEKIEAGMEVWDCKERKWRKVYKIIKKNNDFIELDTGSISHEYPFCYKLKNNEVIGDDYIRITAMRVPLEVEDIETVDFNHFEGAYYILMYPKDKSCGIIEAKNSSVRFGTKYYDQENAKLVCEMLNGGTNES